jgi:hypothetical protein
MLTPTTGAGAGLGQELLQVQGSFQFPLFTEVKVPIPASAEVAEIHKKTSIVQKRRQEETSWFDSFIGSTCGLIDG